MRAPGGWFRDGPDGCSWPVDGRRPSSRIGAWSRRRSSPRWFWDEEKQGGLAVLDVPAEHVDALGGLRQQRVHGTLNGAEFTSNVMPAGGGRLAMSVPRALMKAAGIGVGDRAEVTIAQVGRD